MSLLKFFIICITLYFPFKTTGIAIPRNQRNSSRGPETPSPDTITKASLLHPTPSWRDRWPNEVLPADIMFVISASNQGYVNNSNNINIMKQWVIDVATRLDISRDNVRIGVIQYSHWLRQYSLSEQNYIRTEIALGDCNDIICFANGVQRIRLAEYPADTGAAINKTVMVDFANSRQNTKKIIILFTVAKSKDNIYRAAIHARNQNVTIFSVGIGSHYLQELQFLSNRQINNNNRVYDVSNFNNLDDILPDLPNEVREEYNIPACPPLVTPQHGTLNCTNANGVDSICQYDCYNNHDFSVQGSRTRVCLWQPGDVARWTGVPATCGVCMGVFDLLIILDTALDIDANNFSLIKDFLIRVVDTFHIDSSFVQVSLVHISGGDVVARWNYNWFLDRHLLLTEILNLPATSACVDDLGLRHSVNWNLRRESGKKFNTNHISLVVSDGTGGNILRSVAHHLQQSSKVIAVGMAEVDEDFLHHIASEPLSDYALHLEESYLALLGNLRNIVGKICLAYETISSTRCPVDDLPNPTNCNHRLFCTNSNKPGSLCKAKCCKGYEVTTGSTAVCQYNGRWSQTNWRCTEKPCPSLPQSRGLLINCSNGFSVNSMCVMSCMSGYIAANSNENFDCQTSPTGTFECVSTCRKDSFHSIPKWTLSSNIECVESDWCASNPCLNNATCHERLGGFSCACSAGFSGDRCEINFDDCVSSPCRNGGACHDGANRFSCSCREGYTGDYCEMDIDECQSNPCRNNATCMDLTNDYNCSCPNGYEGKNCETAINRCASHSCLNGGTCENTLNGPICHCAPGYSSSNCIENINECETNICVRGTCIDRVNGYDCECDTGYSGPHCENMIRHCESNSCLSNQTCIETIESESYRCACPEGYTGEFCEINIDDCDPIPCENNGSCIDLVNNYQCSCPIGFTGDNCQINEDDCRSIDCQNGVCVDGIASFTCQCNPGYDGRFCDTIEDYCLISSVENCRNGGICVNRADGFACNCSAGYSGEFCEEEILCPIDQQSVGSNPRSTCYGDHRPGTVCSLECPEGKRPVLINNSNSINRTCNNNGEWSIDDSNWRCETIRCRPISELLIVVIRNGSSVASVIFTNHSNQNWFFAYTSGTARNAISINCSNEEEVDSVCRVSCPSGHRIVGTGLSTCSPSGRWSQLDVTCERYECPEFNVTDGVQCSYLQRSGSICNKTCPTGYKLRGPMEKTCSSNFTWLPLTPWNCVPACDGFPQNTPNAIYHCTDLNYIGSECRSSCNRGFIESKRALFTCEMDPVSNMPVWNGSTGLCEGICQKHINLENGEFHGFSQNDTEIRLISRPSLPSNNINPCPYKATMRLQIPRNLSVILDLSYSSTPIGRHIDFLIHSGSTNNSEESPGIGNQKKRIYGMNNYLFTNFVDTRNGSATSNSNMNQYNIFEANSNMTVRFENGQVWWNSTGLLTEANSTSFTYYVDGNVYVGFNQNLNRTTVDENDTFDSGLCFVCIRTNY